MNILGELEAFRAAHDCEEFPWYEEESDSGVILQCKGCGRKVEYESA